MTVSAHGGCGAPIPAVWIVTAILGTILGTTLGMGLLLQGPAMSAPAPKRDLGPLPASKTALVAFETTPFPYRGIVPEKNKPFLDVADGARLGHNSARGGTYWEDQTYSDQRVLLHIPKGFDPRRPALMIVYFHGNEATLNRDVRSRQQVPRQVTESGLNAVLVAPQFAVNALDSSPGRFWEPGVFAQFVTEAGERLTQLYGDERVRGAFQGAPVVIAAYSGGYSPTAFILQSGHVDGRLRGVVLLDALYGEYDKYADWLAKRPSAFFVSAFGKASRDDNTTLQRMLTERGVSFKKTLPANLALGSITFISSSDDVKHEDFVTAAWVNDPLKVVLRRITGFSRTAAATATGSLAKKK
jgi:hypothetical protein